MHLIDRLMDELWMRCLSGVKFNSKDRGPMLVAYRKVEGSFVLSAQTERRMYVCVCVCVFVCVFVCVWRRVCCGVCVCVSVFKTTDKQSNHPFPSCTISPPCHAHSNQASFVFSNKLLLHVSKADEMEFVLHFSQQKQVGGVRS